MQKGAVSTEAASFVFGHCAQSPLIPADAGTQFFGRKRAQDCRLWEGASVKFSLDPGVRRDERVGEGQASTADFSAPSAKVRMKRWTGAASSA